MTDKKKDQAEFTEAELLPPEEEPAKGTLATSYAAYAAYDVIKYAGTINKQVDEVKQKALEQGGSDKDQYKRALVASIGKTDFVFAQRRGRVHSGNKTRIVPSFEPENNSCTVEMITPNNEIELFFQNLKLFAGAANLPVKKMLVFLMSNTYPNTDRIEFYYRDIINAGLYSSVDMARHEIKKNITRLMSIIITTKKEGRATETFPIVKKLITPGRGKRETPFTVEIERDISHRNFNAKFTLYPHYFYRTKNNTAFDLLYYCLIQGRRNKKTFANGLPLIIKPETLKYIINITEGVDKDTNKHNRLNRRIETALAEIEKEEEKLPPAERFFQFEETEDGGLRVFCAQKTKYQESLTTLTTKETKQVEKQVKKQEKIDIEAAAKLKVWKKKK